ncbi:MAG: T9SS type A sorting domain-containing protein [Candidatus Kapaibacterium sp.]
MKKLIIVIFIITTALQSAEIIPIWNKVLEDNIHDIDVLPNGVEFLLLYGIAEGSRFQIRYVQDGELVREIPGYYASFANFELTPDSNRIVVTSGRGGDLELRNLQTFELIKGKFVSRPEGFSAYIKNIAIDPIRPHVYVTQYGNNGNSSNYEVKSKISVYNYEKMELVKDLTDYDGYEYSAIAVSDDGKYLATLNDGKAYLKVWDLETMELIRNVQLYDDKLPNDWWCEAKDIQFSKLNSDVVYYSGNFPWSGVADTEPSPTNGLRKYTISININSMNIQEKTLSGKFILFDNEERSLVYTYGTMFFYNYKEKFQEFYNKPPQNIYVGGKTIYSEKSNSFIGFAGENLCKFLYDRQTSVNSDIEKEFIISPNPTSSIVNLSLDCSDEKTSYTITNQSGQVVGENTIPMSSNSLQIDLSPFPAGVYFLTIRCGTELKTYKVVREG